MPGIILRCALGVAMALVASQAAAAQPARGVNLTEAQQRLADRGLAGMRGHPGLRGLDRHGEPQVRRVFRDALGGQHVHWQATVDGVPVWGGDFIAHMDGQGALESVTPARVPSLRRGRPGEITQGQAGARLANAARPGTLPLLDETSAVRLAEDEVGCSSCMTAPARSDLWILVVDDAPRLAWRVRLTRLDGSDEDALPVVFVDAQDGFILGRYDDLQRGRATTPYNGTISFDTSFHAGRFYMEDLSRRVGVVNGGGGRFLDRDDVWNASTQIAGADVLWGMQHYLDYLFSAFGRRGLDGVLGPGTIAATADPSINLLRAQVHYGNKYNNAEWVNESYARFGDGDGTYMGPLTPLDIVAHELTHGLTDYTADLVYSGESGAMNESMSDVFGALTERAVRGEGPNVWLIGEQCYTPAVKGDAMRSMSKPHSFEGGLYTGDDYPDHYSERYLGLADNAGVHINSSIGNHAFYLLAQGGSHHLGGGMTGIGADEAAQIWYFALSSYLTSTSNFSDAREATIQAALKLFGDGPQATAVATAWSLVGVESEEPLPPPPVPDSGLIVNGGFEGTADPWSITYGMEHFPDGPLPHTGTGFIGWSATVSGSASQGFTIPLGARSAELSFWLGVEGDTVSTAAEDRLYVEVVAKNGAVLGSLAMFSNLDHSNGAYRQKSRMSLLRWRGQTIRLRFRVERDSPSKVLTSFLIDDVAVK